MKAKEVLQRYKNGERNFQRVNLRGESFQGADLSGADFSEADIRGTNFEEAILRSTNFSCVKAGLPRHSVFGKRVTALSLSLVSGVIAGRAGQFAVTESFVKMADQSAYIQISIIFSFFFTLLLGFVVSVRRGLLSALGGVTFTLMLTMTAPIVFAVTLPVAIIGAYTIAGAEIVLGLGGVFIAGLGAVVANLIEPKVEGTLLLGAILLSVTIVILGAFIAWRAMRSDNRDNWIRNFVLDIAAGGGTSFRNADLTHTDFTKATLKNTDLRAKSLLQTCWQSAVMLDQAFLDKTPLAQTTVRNLLVTRNGYKQSYIGANLEGANLTGVNLEQANLKRANLSQATLQGANLKDANLTATLSLGTNYTHAYLTGACLEAWTIDETTILSNVDCQYVFFLERPNHLGSRERRPHHHEQVFAPGDFEKLYQKIINTVQILLRGGVNRESFAAAFQKVMQEFPEVTPDSIQGMNKRGEDVIVTIDVEPDTDKGKLAHTFTETYEHQLELERAKNEALQQALEAEQRHSQDIKEMHLAALVSCSSSVTITNSNTAESKAMSDSQEKKGIFAENVGGNFSVSNVNLNLDNVNSTVTSSINELPANPEPDQPSVKELLSQLQTAINEEENLDDEDKAEALAQVQTLAEAGQNPKEKQKLAKRATTMLKGIVAGLPSAAKLAEEANQLLPLIAGWFGL